MKEQPLTSSRVAEHLDHQPGDDDVTCTTGDGHRSVAEGPRGLQVIPRPGGLAQS